MSTLERDLNPGDPNWTLPAALEHVVASRGDSNAGFTFLQADGSERHYSFADILAEVRRRGRHLLAKGLRKGDRVALIIPDSEDFVLTFLAAAFHGIVPVPMFPPLSFGNLDGYISASERTLKAAEVSLLLTSKQVQSVLWSLVDRVPQLDSLVCVENLTGEAKDAPEPEVVGPDDLAFLQFTSGSTAAPKGVMVSNRTLGANLHAIMIHGLKIVPETDVAVSWLPLYHDMGLIGFMLAPLCWGVRTIYIPTLSFVKHPTTWMETVSKYRGTITFAPNFAFALAARRTNLKKLSAIALSSLRVLGCGAEPNPPATLRAFTDHFAPAGLKPEALLPVYGMAEATLAMAFSRLDESMRTDIIDGELYADEARAHALVNGDAEKAASSLEYVICGRALPEHEVVIIDEHGKRLPDRLVGEIVFRGPSVAVGYFEDPANTEAVFTADGLRTGDLGYLVDGELYVTGRKKDIIILNGRNYDPQTVEWLAADVEGVRKGNVIAFSRPGTQTEELVIVAETRSDDPAPELAQQIREAVRQELFLNAADVVLVKKGSLPKTSSGKLKRSETRRQYLDGQLGGGGVRTLGHQGPALTVAKHLARSMVSRVRHSVRHRASDLLSALRTQLDDANRSD